MGLLALNPARCLTAIGCLVPSTAYKVGDSNSLRMIPMEETYTLSSPYLSTVSTRDFEKLPSLPLLTSISTASTPIPRSHNLTIPASVLPLCSYDSYLSGLALSWLHKALSVEVVVVRSTWLTALIPGYGYSLLGVLDILRPALAS
jgi:hypothetical protein